MNLSKRLNPIVFSVIVAFIIGSCSTFNYPNNNSIKTDSEFAIISIESGIDIIEINNEKVDMKGSFIKAPFSLKLIEGQYSLVLQNINKKMQGAIRKIEISVEKGRRYRIGKQYISTGGPREFRVAYVVHEVFK